MARTGAIKKTGTKGKTKKSSAFKTYERLQPFQQKLVYLYLLALHTNDNQGLKATQPISWSSQYDACEAGIKYKFTRSNARYNLQVSN